jgi:hypothetical protein
MQTMFKYACAAALVGAVAAAGTVPSEARNGRNAAFAAGAVAGATVGAAAASSYYGPGYYGPAYAYEPVYGDEAYAYEPAVPVYVAPSDSYYPNRWQDQHSTNNFSISSQN